MKDLKTVNRLSDDDLENVSGGTLNLGFLSDKITAIKNKKNTTDQNANATGSQDIPGSKIVSTSPELEYRVQC